MRPGQCTHTHAHCAAGPAAPSSAFCGSTQTGYQEVIPWEKLATFPAPFRTKRASFSVYLRNEVSTGN